MTQTRYAAVAVLALGALAGCASATVRRLDDSTAPVHPAGIVQIAWRTSLHDHGLFEPAPEECASGVLANGRLVLGSRAANLVGIAPETKRYVMLKSRIHWRAGLRSLAHAVVECAGTGVCTSDYAALKFRNVRRPIYPLEDPAVPA